MADPTTADAAPDNERDDPPVSRRERLRRELVGEVLDTARRHLAEGGPAAVSWRGIAREVGINPASLYTYFDSLDDLFTAVILDSFGRLAQAINGAARAAADGEPVDRVMACAHAYRSWALEHPAEFNLVFTDRIPGYQAPPGGPTVAIQDEIFGPFVAALDALDGEPDAPLDVRNRADERVALWATMHGLVMLEINHHLPFVEDTAGVFDRTLRRELAR
jgi:AcrR family transcriptional regulator